MRQSQINRLRLKDTINTIRFGVAFCLTFFFVLWFFPLSSEFCFSFATEKEEKIEM